MMSPDLLCTESESCLSLNPIHVPADRNLHGVVLGANEKTGLLKSRYDGHSGMEPFHTLQRRQRLSI